METTDEKMDVNRMAPLLCNLSEKENAGMKKKFQIIQFKIKQLKFIFLVNYLVSVRPISTPLQHRTACTQERTG